MPYVSGEVGLNDRSEFGLIFVLVNTGSLPAAVAVLFRVLAVIAFIAVLVAVVVAGRRPTPAGVDGPPAVVSRWATGLWSWPRSGPTQLGLSS